MGYNWLLGAQQAAAGRAAELASDLHAYLVSGARMERGRGRCASGAAKAAREE